MVVAQEDFEVRFYDAEITLLKFWLFYTDFIFWEETNQLATLDRSQRMLPKRVITSAGFYKCCDYVVIFQPDPSKLNVLSFEDMISKMWFHIFPQKRIFNFFFFGQYILVFQKLIKLYCDFFFVEENIFPYYWLGLYEEHVIIFGVKVTHSYEKLAFLMFYVASKWQLKLVSSSC